MKFQIHKKIFAISFVLITLISCTHYIYISRSIWQGNAVVADGKPAEWTTPLKYYDESSKLQFAVSNDFQNLYVCIRATEEQTQSKIMRAGLQLWIDTTGKNEHRVGILFPMANTIKKTDQSQGGERNTGEKHDVSAFRNKFLNEYKEMELSGFNPPINGMNLLQNNYGITVSINWDSSQIMTYEAVIPFKTFYKDLISVSDSLKLMGVSIVLNALPAPQGGGGGGSHGGGRGSGGGGGMPGGGAGRGVPSGSGMRGGGGGGMHGGGGGGGYSQGSSYLFEANTIKKIFQLSVK